MKEKNIVMDFQGCEGTTYVHDLINRIKHVYIPGYESLDYCHVKKEKNEFKKNIIELAKLIFNPKEVLISNEKIKSLSLFSNIKNITKEQIIKEKKNKITFLKWRVKPEIYKYFNNELNIDIVLLPVRYSFSRIYGKYFDLIKDKRFCKFNSQRNNNMEENLNKIVVEKDILSKVIQDHCNYLEKFKIKYYTIKKTNIPIVIIDYYHINNNEYLNKKLGTIFNEDFELLSQSCWHMQTIKKYNWIDLFDKGSKEIILKEKKNYEKKIKKQFMIFLKKIKDN